MKQVILATGNQRKVREASETLAPFEITVIVKPVEAEEIQHHDPAEITKAKAKAAYAVLQEPVVVQDTSWAIPALGGFPGGYMKDVASWLTPEDWIAMTSRHEDKTIICLEHVAYYDGKELHHFQSSYTGTIIDESRGEDGDSIDKVVVLFDNQTMAEMHDRGKLATASIVLEHWKQFGEWYKNHEE